MRIASRVGQQQGKRDEGGLTLCKIGPGGQRGGRSSPEADSPPELWRSTITTKTYVEVPANGKRAGKRRHSRTGRQMLGYHLNSNGSWFIAPAPHEPGDNGSTFLNGRRCKEGRKEVSNRIAVCRSREGGREGGREAGGSGSALFWASASLVHSPALRPLSAECLQLSR